jgi:GT2 family glycosyltransferase
MTKTLGVVMVYIGNTEFTLNCIETLARTAKNFFATDLFLFKNGPSRDGMDINEDYLFSLNSDVFRIHHIKLPVNVGIIKTRNIGCETVLRHGSDYCLVCDNDILFGDGWPEICLEAMRSHNIIGDGIVLIDFSAGTDWFKYCNHYYMTRLNNIYDTAYVSTCFMFMKREVLLNGAQFDPYWMHRYGCGGDIECHGGANEDMDFCFQARSFGFKIAAGHVPYVHCPSSGRILFDNDGRMNERNQEVVQKIFYKKWGTYKF